MEDQSVDLLCLGVFARLALPYLNTIHSEDTSGLESVPAEDSNDVQSAVSPISVQYFFREKRAPKTIQLVVLRVILACSDNIQTSKLDTLETISLATEIIQRVSIRSKTEWIDRNPKLMQKLHDKITRLADPTSLLWQVRNRLGRIDLRLTSLRL